MWEDWLDGQENNSITTKGKGWIWKGFDQLIKKGKKGKCHDCHREINIKLQKIRQKLGFCCTRATHFLLWEYNYGFFEPTYWGRK